MSPAHVSACPNAPENHVDRMVAAEFVAHAPHQIHASMARAYAHRIVVGRSAALMAVGEHVVNVLRVKCVSAVHVSVCLTVRGLCVAIMAAAAAAESAQRMRCA